MQKTIKIIKKGTKDLAKDLVCKYLEERSYIVIEKTFEFRRQKIDLIVYDETTKELVFVEIKLYNIPNISKKIDIEIERQEFLKAAAKNYNYEYGLYDIPVRFDKVELLLNNSIYKIRYIKNFFEI